MYFICKFSPCSYLTLQKLSQNFCIVINMIMLMNNIIDDTNIILYSELECFDFFEFIEILINKQELIISPEINNEHNYDEIYVFENFIVTDFFRQETNTIKSLRAETLIFLAIISNKKKNFDLIINFFKSQLSDNKIKFIICSVVNKNFLTRYLDSNKICYTNNICINFLMSLYDEYNIPKIIQVNIQDLSFSGMQILERFLEHKFIFINQEISINKILHSLYVSDEVKRYVNKTYCFILDETREICNCNKIHRLYNDRDRVYETYFVYDYHVEIKDIENYDRDDGLNVYPRGIPKSYNEDLVTFSFNIFNEIQRMKKINLNNLSITDKVIELLLFRFNYSFRRNQINLENYKQQKDFIINNFR